MGKQVKKLELKYEEIKKREEERLGKPREERKRKIEPEKKENKLDQLLHDQQERLKEL